MAGPFVATTEVITGFAAALGVAFDHQFGRRLLIRLDTGTAAGFFGDRIIRVPGLEPEVVSGTTRNRHVAFSLGIRL